jgi:hypothetical protein
MEAKASRFFISYSRRDSEFVRRLAQDLQQAGANVWMDSSDIELGQRWDKAVTDALSQCSHVLVILSPSGANSNNVLDEIDVAVDEQKEIVPILYQDCDIPLRLRRFQRVDFSTDYAHALTALLTSLGLQSQAGSQTLPGNQAVILPDGITYNMADELIKKALVQDAGSSKGITDKPHLLPPDNILKTCSGNYVKSLEDIASAAIFWDAVAFDPRRLRTVSDDPAGVLSHLKDDARMVPIDVGAERRSPRELLESRLWRGIVQKSIAMLKKPGPPWSEHMIREVWLYKDKEWDLAHRDLVKAVPDEYTNFVIREVSSAYRNSPISDKKLRDFVKKNIVTHLVTYEWYCGLNGLNENIHYQPHTTRADLDRRKSQNQLREAVAKLALPAVMFNILKESHTAKDLLDGIAKYSKDKAFAPIRKALAGASADPDDLASDLTRACTGLDFFSDMQLRFRRKGGLVRIGIGYANYKKHTREYRNMLCNIFRDLDPERIRVSEALTAPGQT